MDSNMDLSIGFKGSAKINAQAIPMQEGYLKLGGIAGETLPFGSVVSAHPDTPDEFKKGCPSGNVVRGVTVFDDAIAQNAPAHSDKYLEGLPCAAINHGFLWLSGWTKTAPGAIEPVIGCKVIFKDDTGAVEFVAGATAVPAGWTELKNASVRGVDVDNGALVFLG